jgi:tetratricopeptide (TPR) repeat protein
LFEAEECLARGQPDKALVLASRAVKERPDSLTARALLDRARRETLRGRRRERLDTRVQDASGKVDAGDLDGAERIVTSALKLVPDHELALELLARIKQQRLGGDTAEAEALRELERLAGMSARKALESARTALAAGRNRQAFLAVRQGLRNAPGDSELLELMRDTQKSIELLERERARRHALNAQVRAGLDLLARGSIEESLRILRVVLNEEPDNARAQAAVQQVRKVWLTRVEFATALGAGEELERPASEAPPAPVPTDPVVPRAARRVPPPRTPPAPTRDARHVPVELRLPATRRRATPVALVLGGGALIVAALGWLMFSGRAPLRQAPPPAVLAELPAPSAETPAAVEPASLDPVPSSAPTPGPGPADPASALEAPGPWSDAPPELRAAAESRLTAYARALETADPQLLAVARPDLTSAQRKRALEPFLDALSAAIDLRVLRVAARADDAEVVVRRSDVIGDGPRRAPVEETLRFRREGGEWVLR